MVTHVTYRPHYCDRRYGEYVSDRIYHMRLFGLPRNIPVVSNILIGRLNSLMLPDDTTYLCNGAFELYPVYYRKSKAKIVTMMKELTFWVFDSLPEYKQEFLRRLFSVNTGIITDTKVMEKLVKKQMDVPVEVVHPFCAQPFLENKPALDEKKLIFIGSFESPNKGYKELVKAFKLLGEEWELYMIGKRGMEFVTEKMDGLHITGHVPSLKPYLARCSIYVHPALFEPFGITVLEAMSAGLLPVVTKQTGISEVLKDNGLKNLLARDNKPETLAKKIWEVHCYSPGKKRRISDKCKKIVKRSYMEPQGLEKFKQAFCRIVD